MKADLERFRTGLAFERRATSFLEAGSNLLNLSQWADPGFLLDELKEAQFTPTEVARYGYRATVIGVYGYFEQLIEALLSTSAREHSLIAGDGANLPDRVSASHIALSLEVASRVAAGRYPRPLDKAEIVSRLHGVLAGVTPLELNDVVFAEHKANFRHSVVSDTFNRLGLKAGLLVNDSDYLKVVEAHFPGGAPFAVIDDLAQRRNEIAHGSTSDLLAPEILSSYMSVLDTYAVRLVGLIQDQLVRLAIVSRATGLGRPDGVWKRRIVGFQSLAESCSVGDLVACVPAKGLAFVATIESIEVSGVASNKATTGDSVGLALSKEIGQRPRLFKLTYPCEALV